MLSLLLPIIYLAFISLGLPDALIGAAWPSMYPQLGASVSWAGILSMLIAFCTIISSLLSERLVRRFGTGLVTLVSVAMTAAALWGFSSSSSFAMLLLWAIPYGLGAGSVDAALNGYVALHYKARHMSWLHCMWGLGASVGPVIMARALATSGWNMGFFVIAVLQAALTLALLLSQPLWKRGEGAQAASTQAPRKNTRQVLALPGVREVLICFFCYCALETTAGMWAASYCTLYRGIPAQQAAGWASLFYMGITAGRFVCGFITMKLSDQNMIRLGQCLIGVGVLLILLPAGNAVLLVGLLLVGCGCAPIYPSIIHSTPANFGADVSQTLIGIQMACAYTGSCLMPPLLGLLCEHVSFMLYPVCLGLILLLQVVMSERQYKKTAPQRALYRPL